MHISGSVESIPLANTPVIAKPTNAPIGAIKPAIAVALALSSSENHRFPIRLIELRTSGFAAKKMKVPIETSQKFCSPTKLRARIQQPIN